MNIVVFIKQVPDTEDVKWTENNNIDRTKMDSVINPEDRCALEAALTLKDKYGANVTAVSMGPKKAKEILSEAIAMGIDEAKLLCDSKFAGSDTCATSRVLAACIKNKYPDTDIVFFGQTAIDGETGQTGVSTAIRLDMPCFSHVKEIKSYENGTITLISDYEDSTVTYQSKTPAAICIHNSVYTPRLPKISGYIKAKDYNYECMTLSDLCLDETSCGLNGSPTYVSSVFKSNDKRNCKIIDSVPELAKEIKGATK